MKNTKDTRISTHLGPPLRLAVGPRPHWSAWPRGRAPPTSGSRRRWGPRPRGEHHRAPRSEAHPRVLLDRPEDAGAPSRASMAARRRCSPWPGRSGAVERARGSVEASPLSYGPNAPKSKRNEAETSEDRRGGALRRGRGNSGERFTACDGLSPR